jgi:hypothetical protein
MPTVFTVPGLLGLPRGVKFTDSTGTDYTVVRHGWFWCHREHRVETHSYRDIELPVTVHDGLEVLKKTREILVRDGWCQYVWNNQSGEHCLYDAVSMASPCDVDEYVAVQIIQGLVGGNIIKWNDKPGRAKDEVLGVLDKAIKGVQR